MKTLDASLTLSAIRLTGDILAKRGVAGPMRVLIVGGAAGLLGGWLRPGRTTGDCDAMRITPENAWKEIADAVKEAAAQLDLPATWMNRDCATYAWCMPLGWEERCELVGRFGPLETLRASRLDLIAAKVVSAPSRPQDIEDLHDLHPTAVEFVFVSQHLDRLERESLAGATLDEQRDILRSLGGEP